MPYTRVGLVILSLVVAIGLGYLVPLRYGFNGLHFSFLGGMLAGSPVVVLGGMMAGGVIGGLGEEWLGTTFGVPIGLFIGCFAGVAGLNYLCGGLVMGIVVLIRRMRVGRRLADRRSKEYSW